MSNPLVSVNLVVLNGEKYVRHFLDSVLAQTYPHELIELNILDNGSGDKTKEIIKETRSFTKSFLIESKKNLGMWPGQEELLKCTNGKYVVATAVDIILDKDFIKNTVKALEKDDKIGALQPKIYKFDLTRNSQSAIQKSNLIDTCGFQIFRSRRIVNIGHGQKWEELIKEQPSFAKATEGKEIFAVEGAVPVFRKEAFESCRINIPYSISHTPYSEIADHNFFWYGDDLDITWRMRLFGWKEVFAPDVIAWHDRQTTKTLKKGWLDYFFRISLRRQIPIKKRRLDWRNLRWTLIKNDYIINILKDLPWIAAREIAVLGYAVLFEPGVLKEIPAFFRHLPEMLQKRKEIMKHAIVSPEEIRKWLW